jgi:hypothetical protein
LTSEPDPKPFEAGKTGDVGGGGFPDRKVEGLGGKLKAAVRANHAAYEAVRRARAWRQERAYVELRDRYAEAGGAGAFSPPGYLARSRSILDSREHWVSRPKSQLAEVRVLAAIGDLSGGPRVREAFERAVDLVLFDMGAYRTSYDPAHEPPGWRDRLQRDLVEAARAAHAVQPLDAVIVYGSHTEFEPATLNTIRELGVLVAVMWLDDKHTFREDPDRGYPNGQEPLIGSVDVHITNSRECVRWYMARGAAAYHMPQGIDTELYKPLPNPAYEFDVSFLGQRYGFRGRFIDTLRASGIEIECFGPGWGTRVISDAEAISLYRTSRVNLGLGGVAYSDRITCVKGRDTEVPACGGFYLSTFDTELTELFDVGREIACYRNEIDCVEQIRYYLEAEDERRKIAAAGRARCVRDHSWESRLHGFLSWLGMLEPVATHRPMPS